MYKLLKEIISCIILALLAIFIIRSFNNEEGIIKYSIDVIYEYYNYADSLFNK